MIEYDNRIIGCASLHPYIEDKMAELACLAIDPQYRGGGRGDKLFNYCQKQAKKLGFNQLFCLTTRAEHWFLERGFTLLALEKLPKSKQTLYNLQRKSKVFVKKL